MITKEDLNELEQRLTQLIQQKFGNPELPQSVENAKAEDKKPIWETRPTWEDCRTNRKRYYTDYNGTVISTGLIMESAQPFSEALAKRQISEIKLMEIAEKWNSETELQNYYTIYYSHLDKLEISSVKKRPFRICFNSEELAQKSIELHKELWEQYFMIE